MSIDEIVASERDNAEFSKANNYDKSADYHNQIAELLEELKAVKEMDLDIPQHFTKDQSDWIKAYCIGRNVEFYNKAIHDAIKIVKENYRMEALERLEQLKAGGYNENTNQKERR